MGMNMERQMWQTSRSTMWKMAMGSLLAAGAGWMMWSRMRRRRTWMGWISSMMRGMRKNRMVKGLMRSLQMAR
jgi:hypothetical protein